MKRMYINGMFSESEKIYDRAMRLWAKKNTITVEKNCCRIMKSVKRRYEKEDKERKEKWF